MNIIPAAKGATFTPHHLISPKLFQQMFSSPTFITGFVAGNIKFRFHSDRKDDEDGSASNLFTSLQVVVIVYLCRSCRGRTVIPLHEEEE